MYKINLIKNGNRISVKHINRNLRIVKREVEINIRSVNRRLFLQKKRQIIKLTHVGLRGPQGIQGPTGPQGPQGEVGPDVNFTQEFTISSTVPVNHNLNKYPSVNVIDSAGDEVMGEIFYSSLNQVILTFAAPFSGRVTCN